MPGGDLDSGNFKRTETCLFKELRWEVGITGSRCLVTKSCLLYDRSSLHKSLISYFLSEQQNREAFHIILFYMHSCMELDSEHAWTWKGKFHIHQQLQLGDKKFPHSVLENRGNHLDWGTISGLDGGWMHILSLFGGRINLITLKKQCFFKFSMYSQSLELGYHE